MKILKKEDLKFVVPLYKPEFITNYKQIINSINSHKDSSISFNLDSLSNLINHFLNFYSYTTIQEKYLLIVNLLTIAQTIEVLRKKSIYNDINKFKDLINSLYGPQKERYNQLDIDMDILTTNYFMYQEYISIYNTERGEVLHSVPEFLRPTNEYFLSPTVVTLFSSLDYGLFTVDEYNRLFKIDIPETLTEAYNEIKADNPRGFNVLTPKQLLHVAKNYNVGKMADDLVYLYLQLFHNYLVISPDNGMSLTPRLAKWNNQEIIIPSIVPKSEVMDDLILDLSRNNHELNNPDAFGIYNNSIEFI